ncbi:V-type ATP synthase subunit F, partial [Nanoarchaeota archaeon]
VLGMKLAGANKCLLYESNEAEKFSEEVKKFDIIIMTESIAQELREKDLLKEVEGIIVRVPDKSGSKGLAMKEISQLFESALGLKIEN